MKIVENTYSIESMHITANSDILSQGKILKLVDKYSSYVFRLLTFLF